MTDPNAPVPTNEELEALAEEQDVKGDEIGEVAQGVVDFVTAGQTALKAAQDELARIGLPDAQRQSIQSHLSTASGEFGNAITVLRALIAPPTPEAKARKAKKGKR